MNICVLLPVYILELLGCIKYNFRGHTISCVHSRIAMDILECVLLLVYIVYNMESLEGMLFPVYI